MIINSRKTMNISLLLRQQPDHFNALFLDCNGLIKNSDQLDGTDVKSLEVEYYEKFNLPQQYDGIAPDPSHLGIRVFHFSLSFTSSLEKNFVFVCHLLQAPPSLVWDVGLDWLAPKEE
ncbi:hypothetical protein NPIL_316741 [Nephila pilipes]|uniref:Uncharacterized protein n=1 Tax=Nephila pilipes TaxID=299642 RepID=A0A8X6QPG7_NEPPI|nr:hypothetical protein NPIL_316741 [Nephila pilipes]